VGALAIGLFGAFAILLIHLPPGPVAILALLALLALGLWPVIKHYMASRAGAPPAQTPAPSTLDYPHGVEWYTLAAIDASVAAKASGDPPDRGHRARYRRLFGRLHRGGFQLALGCAGLALFAAGASFAVTAAQKEWVPPPELSVEVAQGEPVASVNLGTAAGVSAHLAVVKRGQALWSAALSSTSGTQNVVLPAGVLRPGAHMLLVANGKTIRSVYG
jgi:hypothetical protein